jgi:hypothetical protein
VGLKERLEAIDLETTGHTLRILAIRLEKLIPTVRQRDGDDAAEFLTHTVARLMLMSQRMAKT